MFKTILTFVISFTFLIVLTPSSSHAAVNWEQKGLTLRLVNQDISLVDESLKTLAATGANYVAITPGYHTDTLTSSNIDRKDRTPSDELLIYTINKAHIMGLEVFMKPHVDPKTGDWRARMDPDDKETFFDNYKKMLVHYAQLSEQYGVEQFSLGSELYKISTNPENEPYWRDIISEVKSVYTGKLTYNANLSTIYFDETKLPFWDELDYIGLSLYHPLAEHTNPTVDELVKEWRVIDKNFVEPLYNQHKKPILITELGYRSLDGAAMDPGNYKVDAAIDLQEQKDLYEALFTFWQNRPYMLGLHIWDWQISEFPGGETNADYTAQNKPALSILTNAYGGISNIISTDLEDSTNEQLAEDLENLESQEEVTVVLTDGIEIDTVEQVNVIKPIGYKVAYAVEGSRFYTDRDYTIIKLPEYLKDEALIVTTNNDKLSTNKEQVVFEIESNMSVYVAYDSRATTLPTWLRPWTSTEDIVTTSDIQFKLYKLDFEKGDVVLGGNSEGSEGAKSNYFVFVTKKVNDISTQTLPGENIEEINQEDVEGAIDVIEQEVIIDGSDTNVIEIEETQDTESSTSSISGNIVVDYPQTGSIMVGEKKIKIYIPGLSREQYTASLNVDGRSETQMEDSKSDEFKQAKIQFNTWKWNGSGPYVVNITAKDLTNAVIDTHQLVLFVKT